jgi:hypothetical protein
MPALTTSRCGRVAALALTLLAAKATAQVNYVRTDYIRIQPLKVAVVEKARLVGSFSDTVKAVRKLTAGDSLRVVGRDGVRGGHWAVVREGQETYLLSTRYLTPASKAAFNRALGLVSVDAPVDWDTRKITFAEVTEVPGVSKTQLYERAKAWAKDNGTKVVEDVPGERLLLRAELRARVKSGINAGTVTHTVSLYFKDGRYKSVLTDLIHQGPPDATLVSSGGPLETEGVRLTALGGLPMWQSLRRNVVEDAQARQADIHRRLSAAPAKDPSDF